LATQIVNPRALVISTPVPGASQAAPSVHKMGAEARSAFLGGRIRRSTLKDQGDEQTDEGDVA